MQVELGIDRVELPIFSCELTRGDTTYHLVADNGRRVLILSRTFAVEPARQPAIHDSLQFAIATRYEAPAICRDAQGRSESEVRIWKTLDRQIALKNVGADRILLELRVNHPGCTPES
jgi:hypothetical protein